MIERSDLYVYQHQKEKQRFSPCKASRLRRLHGVKNSRKIKMLALQLDYHIKEEARMKYLNAQVILPDALVKELQTYVQGGYIYVPIEQEQQKRWGEVSGYRQELEQRNQRIKEEYQSGISMECLSEKYCLSLYAVRKIIYQK